MLRLATQGDVKTMMQIINHAIAFLKELGVDQWQNGYPNEAVLLEDINKKQLFVLEQEGQINAISAFIIGNDPTYEIIYNGSWLQKGHYATIHRSAVRSDVKGKGLIGQLFQELELLAKSQGIPSLRIDTHPDNFAMQKAITKNGFAYCGQIYLADGALRLAYEKIL